MIDAPNIDKIEEYDDWERLSLESLSAAYGDHEPNYRPTMPQSVNPETRQTLVDELAADLAQFESQYGMTSSEFNQRFESGELGDEMDYFDWSAAFLMFTRIQNEQRASE